MQVVTIPVLFITQVDIHVMAGGDHLDVGFLECSLVQLGTSWIYLLVRSWFCWYQSIKPCVNSLQLSLSGFTMRPTINEPLENFSREQTGCCRDETK